MNDAKNVGELILSVECKEPEGTFTRHVRMERLSFERLEFIWNKCKEFKILFNDFVDGDFKAFVNHFVMMDQDGLTAAGIIYAVDDVGLFIVNDIRPALSATIHYLFWDKRFRGREELCRRMMKHVFDEFKFRRLETRIPLIAQPAIQNASRIGLIREGRLRKAILYEGEWVDMNLYSMLPEDLENDPRQGGESSVRSVCLDCGKNFDKIRTPKARSLSHGT